MVERVIVKVSVLRLGLDHFLNLGLNVLYLIRVSLNLEQLVHIDGDKVHGKLEHLLLSLYLRVHKVTSNVKANVWLESFLSDLFDETS